jgi:hypothetical protein
LGARSEALAFLGQDHRRDVTLALAIGNEVGPYQVPQRGAVDRWTFQLAAFAGVDALDLAARGRRQRLPLRSR